MARRGFHVIAVLLIAASFEAALHACPVCFRFEDGPTVAGTRAAVFVLVGVTSLVLSACGTFVVRFARRASSLAAPHSPSDQ